MPLNDLFGYFNEKTREWTDGALTCIMRKQAVDQSPNRKLINFDGPIEPDWVENLNSVLDDCCNSLLATGCQVLIYSFFNRANIIRIIIYVAMNGHLQYCMSPVGSVGQEAEVGERLFRASGLSLELGQDVGELDEELSEALALIRRQRLKQKDRNSGKM